MQEFLRTEILNLQPLGGGSINRCYRVQTVSVLWFVKVNTNPDLFRAEEAGLQTLARTGMIRVPEVKGRLDFEGLCFLVLQFIDKGRKVDDFWTVFAHQLADLHRNSSSMFGLDHNKYMGSLPQDNTKASSWAEFFGNRRLLAQARLAEAQGRLDKKLIVAIEKLAFRLKELLPDEQPSLLRRFMERQLHSR